MGRRKFEVEDRVYYVKYGLEYVGTVLGITPDPHYPFAVRWDGSNALDWHTAAQLEKFPPAAVAEREK